MTEPTDPHVVIVPPDGAPAAASEPQHEEPAGGGSITDLVEQPAKVMRIGSMIRQLLEEVKAAPLDEASRQRLREIHSASIKELEQGLAPELVEELERLSLPFSDETPSEAELRIAQAQLVGWLEGLFHGIQTVIYAQQMAARPSSSRCAGRCQAACRPDRPGRTASRCPPARRRAAGCTSSGRPSGPLGPAARRPAARRPSGSAAPTSRGSCPHREADPPR
jgi:hypothetical protein